MQYVIRTEWDTQKQMWWKRHVGVKCSPATCVCVKSSLGDTCKFQCSPGDTKVSNVV